MPKAMRIHETGAPEVMKWEDIELPPPGPGEVRLRHRAAGLNYADINLRRGGFYLYSPPSLPTILGNEAAGVVEALGPGVTQVKVGDRVAYVSPSGMYGDEAPGGYAEARNIPADRLVLLPDGVSERQAAALMAKGLTASAILHRLYRIQSGDKVLIHAAAGGMGTILTQWAKHLGATVIGTVGSTEKESQARASGCDHPILYRETDFVAAVRKIAPEGVAAVFDGVGKDTFMASLDCMRPYATIVSFGNASGPVPPLDIRVLSQKGTLIVTRPGLTNYIADRTNYERAAGELFDLVERGIIRFDPANSYALKDAVQAHRDLESRKTVGSVVLIL
jgi:NADPH2:quinone reductase